MKHLLFSADDGLPPTSAFAVGQDADLEQDEVEMSVEELETALGGSFDEDDVDDLEASDELGVDDADGDTYDDDDEDLAADDDEDDDDVDDEDDEDELSDEELAELTGGIEDEEDED